MVADRITVSLDDDARAALNELVGRTGQGNSELVRRAVGFYAANFEAATAEADVDLERYQQLLASGEHALLDIDFLHVLLAHVRDDDGTWPEEFVADLDTVADYHAAEYESQFTELGELLDWLSVCGFLTVRESAEHTYQVVFPTEDLKWFMLRFIRESTADLPFELDIEEGVSKVLLTERPA